MTIRPKVKPRLLAFFIAVILISCICGSAFANEAEDVSAQESFVEGDYEYALLNDGTAEIKKYFGEDNVLNIPADLAGISVTHIGNEAFSWCENLTEITIPDSVTSIGDFAFKECTRLTEITIPNSVTSIGEHAFWFCTSLTKITIPDSVTSIGNAAFDNCKSLTEITIPDSVTSIRDETFFDCFSLAEITISENVTSIGNAAFANCESLTEITIPDSVTSIGDKAFSGCWRLTEITIPDSVTSIGDEAFSGYMRLTEITIPNSVTEIGANPFRNCSKPFTVSVPIDHPTLAVIDGVLFSKPDKRLVYYPLTKVGAYTIPQGILEIGNSAFSYCSLTEITIPDSVTRIGDEAFYDCDNLTEITIPDSVTSIGDSAFEECSGLTEITIPNSVTSIGEDAFPGGYTQILIVGHDSYAEQYCENHDIRYQYGSWIETSPESLAAADTLSAEPVSPELQKKVNDFLHRLTGDMGLDLCAPLVDRNPEYIGGYNPAKPVDQKWILGQLTNGAIYINQNDFLPSFISVNPWVAGAENAIVDDENLQWIVTHVFYIDPQVYEAYKTETMNPNLSTDNFIYTKVNYRDGVFYAGIFGWGMCGTNTYITGIQMDGNTLNVDFEYYDNDSFDNDRIINRCKAVMELKEGYGEQYLSLRLMEVEVKKPNVIAQVQQALTAAGYDCGGADGVVGPATITAVNAYQRDHGMAETSFISTGLVNALNGVPSPAESMAQPIENMVQPAETPAATEEETFEDIW